MHASLALWKESLLLYERFSRGCTPNQRVILSEAKNPRIFLNAAPVYL